MGERLATEPWRTAFRASQWLLAASLVLPAFAALPFDALFFAGFGIPVGVTIFVGERLWSSGRTGVLLAIGDLGALTLALVLLSLEPWTQLQASVPGGSPTLLGVCGLGIVGLIGSPAGARRTFAGPRPPITHGALVVAIHVALIVILLGQVAAAIREPHGYSGLAIPVLGGPAAFIALALAAWWLGSRVPLVAVDALLALWGAVRLADFLLFAPYGEGLAEAALALAWTLLPMIGGIAAFRLRPAKSSPTPEASQ